MHGCKAGWRESAVVWEAVCGDDCGDGAINPFAERAGMKKICESKIDRSILQAVAELEKLGWV